MLKKIALVGFELEKRRAEIEANHTDATQHIPNQADLNQPTSNGLGPDEFSPTQQDSSQLVSNQPIQVESTPDEPYMGNTAQIKPATSHSQLHRTRHVHLSHSERPHLRHEDTPHAHRLSEEKPCPSKFTTTHDSLSVTSNDEKLLSQPASPMSPSASPSLTNQPADTESVPANFENAAAVPSRVLSLPSRPVVSQIQQLSDDGGLLYQPTISVLPSRSPSLPNRTGDLESVPPTLQIVPAHPPRAPSLPPRPDISQAPQASATNREAQTSRISRKPVATAHHTDRISLPTPAQLERPPLQVQTQHSNYTPTQSIPSFANSISLTPQPYASPPLPFRTNLPQSIAEQVQPDRQRGSQSSLSPTSQPPPPYFAPPPGASESGGLRDYFNYAAAPAYHPTERTVSPVQSSRHSIFGLKWGSSSDDKEKGDDSGYISPKGTAIGPNMTNNKDSSYVSSRELMEGEIVRNVEEPSYGSRMPVA
jgi:hypothetical protein